MCAYENVYQALFSERKRCLAFGEEGLVTRLIVRVHWYEMFEIVMGCPSGAMTLHVDQDRLSH